MLQDQELDQADADLEVWNSFKQTWASWMEEMCNFWVYYPSSPK